MGLQRDTGKYCAGLRPDVVKGHAMRKVLWGITLRPLQDVVQIDVVGFDEFDITRFPASEMTDARKSSEPRESIRRR